MQTSRTHKSTLVSDEVLGPDLEITPSETFTSPVYSRKRTSEIDQSKDIIRVTNPLENARKSLTTKLDEVEQNIDSQDIVPKYASEEPIEKNSFDLDIEDHHPQVPSYTFRKPIRSNRKSQHSHSPISSTPLSTKKEVPIVFKIQGRSINFAGLTNTTSIYRLCALWMRDNPLYESITQDPSPLEIELPPPEPHTQQTSAIGPTRKRKLSQNELDNILKRENQFEVGAQQLLESHVCHFQAIRGWYHKQYIHRLHRYRHRLRRIQTENNITNFDPDVEQASIWLVKDIGQGDT